MDKSADYIFPGETDLRTLTLDLLREDEKMSAGHSKTRSLEHLTGYQLLDLYRELVRRRMQHDFTEINRKLLI